MKGFLKRRFVVPVAALALTLAIGSVAFAATASSAVSPSTTEAITSVTTQAETDAIVTDDKSAGKPAQSGASATNPWGNQRSDETLLTGDALAKVQAVVLAEVGSNATIIRIETDADGQGAYEGHVVKSDGTAVTVYVDESFNLVSVKDQAAGHQAGDRHGSHPADPDSSSTTTDSTSTSSI